MMAGKTFQNCICAFLAGSVVLASCCMVPAEEAVVQKKKVAVLTYSFSSEYWGYVEQGCRAYEKGNPDVEVTMETPSSSVASGEQTAMLHSDLEAGRYDGYVIASIDKNQIVNELAKAEVPVVALDSDIDAECVIGGIGTDNGIAAAAGAKKAVNMAIDLGWEETGCVMIGGREDDSNNQTRIDGYRKGIEEAGGKWLDAVYPTDKSAEGAREAMEQIMADYPQGVSIVCCYNDVIAEAALAALEGNEAYKNTVIVGFDGDGSVCERIMNDEEYSNFVTVAQNPYEMGYHAVEMLYAYLANADSQGTASKEEKQKDQKQKDQKQDQATEEKAEEEAETFQDSGYSVITKENARERMVQIQSHLS